jgi:hypothetical protein
MSNSSAVIDASAAAPAVSETMDYFEIFPGGKDGVRTRFAGLVKEALRGISFADVTQVLRASKLDANLLQNILANDTQCISKKLIEALVDPLNINIQTGFGEMSKLESDEKLRAQVAAEADEAGFMIVRGVTPVTIQPLDRIKLFALLKAYESL